MRAIPARWERWHGGPDGIKRGSWRVHRNHDRTWVVYRMIDAYHHDHRRTLGYEEAARHYAEAIEVARYEGAWT